MPVDDGTCQRPCMTSTAHFIREKVFVAEVVHSKVHPSMASAWSCAAASCLQVSATGRRSSVGTRDTMCARQSTSSSKSCTRDYIVVVRHCFFEHTDRVRFSTFSFDFFGRSDFPACEHFTHRRGHDFTYIVWPLQPAHGRGHVLVNGRPLPAAVPRPPARARLQARSRRCKMQREPLRFEHCQNLLYNLLVLPGGPVDS